MYRLTKSPDSIVQIFTSLCLSQVIEQLPENLIYTGTNPASFICNGQLFSVIHNRSLILDESLDEFELDFNLVNFEDRVN
jgi:hypothetical protein